MLTMETIDQLTFEPPGPGPWVLDAVHAPRPFSRFQCEIHPPSLAEGFRETGRRYGLLLDYLDWQLVHGFAYFCPRPVTEEADLPARFEAAERAFERKLWREDMERWEREVKPAAVRAHLALQAVDPGTLSCDELLEHLERCREHQKRMIIQHHRFNGAAFIPVGDFLVQASELTGLPQGELLSLLRGAAPESAGASHELDRLVSAIHEDPVARALLESDDEPGELLERLRAESGEVGTTAAAYLDSVGCRLLDSLDVGDPYLLEVPEVVVIRLRVAVAGGGPADGPSGQEIRRVRDRVPPEHWEHFGELLAEARLTYRVRDERGIFSEVWAGGITRRTILAAGQRLAQEGRIQEPAHLVEAGYQEMRDLVAGDGGPSAEELAARARFRATYRASDAPPALGPAPEPPPSLNGLPATAARAMRALDAAIGALSTASHAESEPTLVRGVGASPGVYAGTARLISSPTQFGRLRPGDVLVTHSTTESFNAVLPLLGAIVTNAGGLLCHAAIVSREYGIPGVVGTRDATALIADGTRVRVDGSTGEVRVMG